VICETVETTDKSMLLNLSEKNPVRLLTDLREGISSCAGSLRIELLGPGSLLNDTALMLFHELRGRSSTLRVHMHSHTCLFDGAILLWLAADTRTMRPDAWVQVTEIPETPPAGRRSRHGASDYAASIVAEEECPADTDLRSIIDHLDEWLPVHEVAGLRLFPKDLSELGILHDDIENKALAGYFKATAQIE